MNAELVKVIDQISKATTNGYGPVCVVANPSDIGEDMQMFTMLALRAGARNVRYSVHCPPENVMVLSGDDARYL